MHGFELRRHALSAAFILAASLAVACDRGTDGSTSSLVVERDTIGDTVIVRNISGSKWDDSARLVEQLRIGEADGDPNYSFGRVAVMHVGPDGTIYVFDAVMKALRAYDSTGHYLRTIGGEGGGPGEYTNLLGLATLSDGRLLLRDDSRVNLYATDGSPLTAWPVARGFMMGPSPAMLVADGNAGAYTMLHSGTSRAGETMVVSYALLHLDSTGAPRDTIQIPTWPEIPPGLTRFDVRGLYAFQPTGAFAVARSDRYVIDVADATGHVIRVERPTVVPVALLPQERAEHEAFFAALARRNPAAAQITVPSTKPLLRSLLVAADGRLWVQLHTVAVESDEPRDTTSTQLSYPDHWIEPQAWDVFDPDGSYLGHLELPPRAELRVMRGDYAWGTVLDGDDVPFLVRWRVEHPSTTDQR